MSQECLLKSGPFSAVSRGKRFLFEDVEICLPESTFSVLSGPSGCGKTTLLKMVAGLLHAPGAQRVLAGRQFSDDMLPAWRSRVVLLMQDAPVLSGDVETNLRFPFELANAGSREFDVHRARTVLQKAMLGHIDMDHDARELSGGERHRLAIVRALLWSPAVILADEPFSGLDSTNVSICLELLREFAHTPGKSLLCVMHETGYTSAADISFKLEQRGLLRF